jgi:hypothetical protein
MTGDSCRDPCRDPCRDDQRRSVSRRAPLLGLDYVEVDPVTQTTLQAFFLGRAPKTLTAQQVSLTGGGRPVKVLRIKLHRQKDETLDDWLEIVVDRPGDFSSYALSLANPDGTQLEGFDPRYSSVCFSFKAACATGLDCKDEPLCPPDERDTPAIDYLAKDYASFRQLILDRLAVTVPAWQEPHAPDIGMMLVELLAYVGDQLSYHQDAVATEAYLGTARHRISLRRHARMVDYRAHEGCNARAFVHIAASQDVTLAPHSYFFSTAIPGTAAGVAAISAFTAAAGVQPFEPLAPGPETALQLLAAHNEIRFYTWGQRDCCLPRGAVSATLHDAWVPVVDTRGKRKAAAAAEIQEPRPRVLALKPGDFLLIEEIRGPKTGDPDDADPRHRAVVRLTSVEPAVDPLFDAENGGAPVLEVTWCSEDALSFPVCISAQTSAPNCVWHDDVSCARGNVVLVDHGLTAGEPLGSVPVLTSVQTCATDCAPGEVQTTAGPFGPPLGHSPLTWAEPLSACGCAAEVMIRDPRSAAPQIVLCSSLDGVERAWTAALDLLESDGRAYAFVVETDDRGVAHLRFGDGVNGAAAPAAAAFNARYRVGCGPVGNVGAETIVQIIRVGVEDAGVELLPRNPLAAAGGTSPETLEEIRQFAPDAFRDQLERAITAGDYAYLAADDNRRLAERSRLLPSATKSPPPAPWRTDGDPRRLEDEEPGAVPPLPDFCRVPFQRLQGARAKLEWTGSWYEARVAIDPLGADDPSAAPCDEVAAYLDYYRRIGHDLAVQPPIYVPLDVGLSICVKPGWERGHVEAALLAALGPRALVDGSLGLFHPDNLTFASALHASTIIARAQNTPGVLDAELTRLARFVPGAKPPTATPDQVPADGALMFGAFEIARLDNNPSLPGFGRLTLLLRGGR